MQDIVEMGFILPEKYPTDSITKGSKDFLHRILLPPNSLVLIFGDIGSISSQHFKKQV
jgi:hypothetical protein